MHVRKHEDSIFRARGWLLRLLLERKNHHGHLRERMATIDRHLERLNDNTPSRRC